MSGEPQERPDPDISQDPGIPGPRAPDELPPEDGPDVPRVPDSGEAEVDDEGRMRPPERPDRSRR
jgi:hypothetical protein